MTDVAGLIHQVARGRHGACDLSRAQARAALEALLAPDADALQLGAFLIAERMKGETAEELAGFTEAARACMDGFGSHAAPEGAVDLPCYAGKRRGPPWHLVAALRARDAGIPVLVHGPALIAGRVSAGEVLTGFGVRRARSLREAAEALACEGIAWLDVADACPPLQRLLGLHARLGVRSFAHTVARLLNPLGCAGQLNGVFHTPYALRMARANALLGQPRSLVFMGAEGEPELYADRQKALCLQRRESVLNLTYADAGAPLYPKTATAREVLLEALWSDDGPWDARARAVLARMAEAFALASTGRMPDGWTATGEETVSDGDESGEKSG